MGQVVYTVCVVFVKEYRMSNRGCQTFDEEDVSLLYFKEYDGGKFPSQTLFFTLF